MTFNNSRELALELDNKDPLLSYNDRFHFPVQENGNKHIYLGVLLVFITALVVLLN